MEEVVLIADFNGEGYYFAKGIYDYLFKRDGRKFDVKLIDVERTDFKDGEFKIRISENIRRKNCFLVHDSNKTPCNWFTELAFTLDAMKFSSPSEINVVLPYTKFARQDRKDESRVSLNAKVVANLITRYADRCMTVDLHAPQIQGYFDIPLDNLYSSPTIINYLQKSHPEVLENLVVVSPDVGGGNRVKSFAKRLVKRGIEVGIAIGDKTRRKENEVGSIDLDGSVRGKNCLILDDIIDTGGTLIKTQQKLKDSGAKKVYTYATHGLFTGGKDKFGEFEKVFVADTLYSAPFERGEIISLYPLFGEAIYRTVVGESLSSLFDD